MKNKFQLGSTLIILFGVFFVFVWLNPVFIIQPGKRAIIFNTVTGLKKKIYSEGMHFKLPFVDTIEEYNVRKRNRTISDISAASKDLQIVKVQVSFLFNPMPSKLLELRRTLGSEEEYENKLFPNIPVEVIKAVIAKHTAEELVAKREKVSNNIQKELITRMRANNIVIQEVALSDIQFSDTFSDAIEKKQVAQQQLQAAVFQKQAEITRAQGQAEAARIINQASSSSPTFVELRRIEAQKEIAETLSKSNNITFLPSNMILNADVLSKQKK